MNKKTIRNFILLAFILLLAGGLLMLPLMPKTISKAEENVEASLPEVNLKGGDAFWSETLNEVSAKGLTAGSIYGQTAYPIATATDLAYVAYMVNKGNASYQTGIFYLTANIDLAGSLWTPIGTSTYPFKGTFYGQGYEISNISINEYSCEVNTSSAAAIFGNIENAIIGDLTVSGWMQNYTVDARPRGVIAGVVSGISYIINCYDICTSKIDRNGYEVSTFYSMSAETYYFSGSNRYDSKTDTYVIDNSVYPYHGNGITIQSTATTPKKGIVGVYTFLEGKFKYNDLDWYLSYGKTTTATMSYVLLVYEDITTKIDFFGQDVGVIYKGSKPVLRQDAAIQGGDKVYVYREGYKATITDFTFHDAGTGYVKAISSTATNINVTLNYQYGTRTITYTDWGYDQSFCSYFSESNNSYVTRRLGYEFRGVTNQDCTTDFNNLSLLTSCFYYLCFPANGETYEMNFIKVGQVAYNVKLAIASDEGEKFSDVDAAVAEMSSVLTDVEFDDNVVKNDSYTSTNANTFFYVRLASGYQIGDLSLSSNTVTLSGNKATDRTSGLYVNFDYHTGPGVDETPDKYTSDANKNNDDYAPVSVRGEFVKSVVDGDLTSGLIYRIHVENLCTDVRGDVYLVLERQWVQVDFEFNTFTGVTYEFGVEKETEQTKGKNIFRVEKIDRKDGTFYYSFFGRRWEAPKLYISTKNSPIVSYVLKYPGDVAIHEFKSVGGEANSSYTVNSNTYYKYMTFTLTDKGIAHLENDALYNEDETLDKSVKVDIGPLETMISLKFIDEKGKVLPNTDGTLGAYINYEDKATESILGNIDATLVPITGRDIIDVKSNGIYEADYLKVDTVKVGNFEDSATEVNCRTLTVQPGVLVTPYINGTEGVNHVVEIVFKLRTYDVSYEFYFEGVPVATTEGESYNTLGLAGHELITEITKNVTEKNAYDVVNGSFKLTSIGLGALSFVRYELINIDGTETGANTEKTGFILSTISNEVAPNVANGGQGGFKVTLGTYDTAIRIHFNYKDFDIKFNSAFLTNETILLSSEYMLGKNLMKELVASNMTFNYTADTGLVIKFNDSNASLGYITLHTQFYLLGWYLQNGNVINSDGYQAFFTDYAFVDDIAVAGSVNDNVTFVYEGIAATIAFRTVNVSYNAGNAGRGRIYNSDKTTLATKNVVAGSVRMAQELTLSSTIFYNLGHSFKGWAPSNGYVDGLTYIINGGVDAKSWSYLFDNSAIQEKAWGDFVTLEGDTRAVKDVVLTAQWEEIVYYVSVDGNKTQLSIGENLYYETDQSLKNGQATYFIGGREGVLGSRKDGYLVVGYRLEDGAYVENFGANITFTLSPDNFLRFIADDNKFSLNTEQEPIKIITLREAAPYVLILDNSSQNFYNYNWDETKDTGIFGQSQSGQVTINVVFDSIPVNLQNSIDSGALTINRAGYEVVAWAISNAGAQSAIFDNSVPYTYAYDLHIVPIWKQLDAKTTKAEIAFTEDVGNVRTFYLEKEHNILVGGMSGVNVEASDLVAVSTILANGETLIDYGFIVTFNSKETTYSQQTTLNYNWFSAVGAYQVKFYVIVKDTLNLLGAYPAETYITISAIENFTIAKNSLYFFDFDLHTIYTGNSEFVANTEDKAGYDNVFGSFLYKYDWNGKDLSKADTLVADGLTEEYFDGFSVASQDKNVGSNKDLKMTLKTDKFGKRTLSDVFANVSNESGKYTTIVNGLNIDKARFVISFPKGSAYYINDVQTIVYNNSSNYTFTIGSTTFTYTYDKLMLPLGSKFGLYKGSENHAIDSKTFLFVEDSEFVIFDHIPDRDTNFEWVISKDSEFTLLDSSSALQLNYQGRYLSATNGVLDETLAPNYDGVVDTMSVTNVYVNGKAVTIPTENQFTISVDNNVILYVAGQNSERVYAYVNKEQLNNGHSLSFDIVANVSEERKAVLKPLAWVGSTVTVATLERNFDEMASGYSLKLAPSYSDVNTSYYIVLTDVVKVNLNYNTGKNAEGQESETIYVSAKSSVNLVNPVHEYSGLEFNGYYNSTTNSNLTLTDIENAKTFSVKNGGKTENLKAKWKLVSIDATLVSDTHTYFAQTTSLTLRVGDIATITYPTGITAKTFVLKKAGEESGYTALNEKFTLADTEGYLTASMSGTYGFTLTVIYTDNVDAPQTYTNTLNFTIQINKNQLNFVDDGEHLTFNNSKQEGNVQLEYYVNGEKKEDVRLIQLSTSDNTLSDYNVYYSVNKEMFNAGDYTITLTIDTGLQDVYKMESESQTDVYTLTFVKTIDKYSISLKDYKDTLETQLFKYFGETEPVLHASITITENSNDEVGLIFKRNEGEAIGQYLVTFDKFHASADADNYIIDTDGAEIFFSVLTPSGKLRVNLLSSFSYVYNGYAMTDLEVVYTEGTFILRSITHKDKDWGKVAIEIFFGSGNTQIPEEEREAYAQKIIVTSNAQADVGTYSLFVELSASAGEDWTGAEFVNPALAKIEVTPLALTITKVEKVFDRTNQILSSGVTFANLLSGDDVTLTGQYATAHAGTDITLNNLVLNGAQSGNYTIANTDFKGVITKAEVGSISFEVNNTNFIYGQVNTSVTIQELITLAGGYVFKNGLVTDDIEKGFISLASYAVDGLNISTAGNLKAGKIDVKFVLTSNNFTGLNAEGYSVSFNIDKLDIDLSALTIVKQYDETTLLPADLSTSISEYLIDGDVASIDLTKGGYDTAEIGENKKVTIVLTGADSDCYRVKDTVTGTITSYKITFSVFASREHADLVTDGAFVEDGKNPVVTTSAFTLYYPSETDTNVLMEGLVLPTRTGYNAIGWKYYDEENDSYVALTADNLTALLKSIAEDEENTTNTIQIFTVWSIQEYTITFTGAHVESKNLTATPSDALTGSEKEGYKITYYSSFEVNVKSERGYKINNVNLANGTVVSSILSDVGKDTGVFSFAKVLSNLSIEINTQEISVTFLIDENLPQFTARTDRNGLSINYYYSQLASLKEENLPKLTVTSGTYNLTGYAYGDNVQVGSKTLKDIVDEIHTTLSQDVTVALTANWIGETYVVKFDSNGGTLSGNSEISAVYGSAMTEEFPTCTLPGRTAVWTVNNKVYVQDELLQTVGTKVDGTWTLTLTATWSNNTYVLTVKFDDKLKVYANNAPVVNGQEFSLVYNESELAFLIEASTGYVYEYNADNLNGEILKSTSGYIVKNLTQNGELVFASVPDDNTLTIFTDKVESYKAYLVTSEGDKDLTVTEGKLTAKTESEVKVVFTSLKGWIFGDKSVVFAGNGNYSYEISEDKKTIVVTWKEFIDDATLSVNAEAGDNVVTVGDINGVFASLALNGAPINLNGGTIKVKTGSVLKIEGVITYGYKDGNVETTDGVVKEGSVTNTFSTTDRHYHFKAEVEGFDEDFTLTFVNSARVFNFFISVHSANVAHGEITSEQNQSVRYGETLVLQQRELVNNFGFENWIFANNQVLDFAGNGNLVLTEKYKDLLESANEGQTINIYATYKRKTIDVSFTSTGNGGYIAKQEAENVSIRVLSGTTVSGAIYLGQNLDFVLSPVFGYEIDKLLIDGEEKDITEFGYDVATCTMAVPIELDSTIKTIEITFKASIANVYVQAGMRVNYQDYYGTTAGGYIYLADSTGALLGHELYLPGKNGTTLIGGDYSVSTFTNSTIFFAVTVKEGFTMAISASAGVLINEYQGANGKVYSFAGVVDGSTISVLFTAKENVVNVKFALEGQTNLAHAGIITADTSSNFISAVPNRGDNLSINIITGENLVLGVNSSLAYKLAVDEYGYVKYKIIYGNNDNEFDMNQISVGEVYPSDSIITGYTNSAEFEITNVTSGATIIFYVEPREYSIRYSLFDNISITMAEKVRYGEPWSTNLLTAEEKAKVFANRSGYTFLGYYTMPNGQGFQYIDKHGKVVRDWLEDGYTFNGSTYQLEENFDNATSTFTLYANWLYNRANVTVTFAPTNIITDDTNYNIAHVITNINSLSAWTSQENRWYAEIVVGATIQVKAPEFSGYKFVKWLVYFDGGEGIEKPANFNLSNLEMGSYVLKGVYEPTYELFVVNQNNGLTNGGSIELMQEGLVVTKGSFDSTKSVTLRAIPNEGYRFLYFINNDTAGKFYGTTDANGIAIFTYSTLQTTPISVTAVFTGKNILVNLNTIEVREHHSLITVKVNDRTVDYTKVINAQVGDEISVTIAKSRGYGFEITGADFAYVLDVNGNYVFTHTFGLSELIPVNSTAYSINITFAAPKEKIKLSYELDLDETASTAEIGKTGSLILVGADGKEESVKLNTFYTVLYGNVLTLKIKANENYAFKRAYLYTTDMTYDITDRVNNLELVIDEALMDSYFDYEIKISIIYERLLWTDVRASRFVGNGTKNIPYTLSSPQEFALLAYYVNNGITNDKGVLYADCYYVVTSSLDFSGRYFEPIGTKENPFNGTINLGNYESKHVAHYKDYTNPNTSYSGLFWHLGKKANIIQEKNTVWVVIVIVSSVVVVVGVILVSVLLVRKRKKKRLDDLANDDLKA